MVRLRRAHRARALVLGAALALSSIAVGAVPEPPVKSSLAVVDSTDEASRARAAGMAAGDLVVSLGGRTAPSLSDVLEHAARESGAHDSVLELERRGGRLRVSIPQGEWGCRFRPDLGERELARLDGVRGALDAGEWDRAQLQADQLRGDLLAGGFQDAAQWLRLDLATRLSRARQWDRALAALGSSQWDDQRGASYWAFAAFLEAAKALVGSGRAVEALRSYERAGAAARDAGSGSLLARARSLAQESETDQGNVSESLRLEHEAIALRLGVAPDSPDVATSLNNLGAVAQYQGDVSTARKLFSAALRIQERRAPSSISLSVSLNNLGAVIFDQGDVVSSRRVLLASYRLKERLLPGSLDVAAALNNLGVVTSEQGDLGAARQYYQQALEIKQRLAPDTLSLSSTLNNLGTIAYEQGDLAASSVYHHRALELRQRLAPDGLLLADSLSNLGMIAEDQGDLAAAREYQLQALATRQRIAPDSLEVARSLSSLGTLAADQGDRAGSRDYHLQALAIRQRLAPDSLNLAITFNNLGTLAEDEGNLAAAEESFLKALEIKERVSPDSVTLAVSLGNLARVVAGLGDLPAARRHFSRALTILERLAPGSRDQADVLSDLARAEQAAGNLSSATAAMDRALRALETQRWRAGGEAARTSFAAATRRFYTDMIHLRLASGDTMAALETLERSRARTLLELLGTRSLDFSAEVPSELLERQRELGRRRRALYDELDAADTTTDPAQVAAWRSELLRLPAEEDALAEAIREASPRLAALEYPQPLRGAAIVESLAPGTLLLAYAVADNETFLFRLLKRGRSARLRVSRLDVGEADLELRVRALRTLLASPAWRAQPPLAWREAASSFYAALLGPATDDIARCERILLLPDGPLHLVPFDALIPAGGGRPRRLEEEPLGFQRPILLVPSVTVYAELQAPGRRGANRPGLPWLGFGDPDYRSTSPGAAGTRRQALRPGLELTPLPGTRDEVERISSLLGSKARLLVGEQATETAVRALSGEARLLHFACHGLADSQLPMSSALLLTASEQDREGSGMEPAASECDGVLEAWEVMQDLRLDADCVVLSACETGLGRIAGGEGVLGLTRAFFFAGARSVVVSLWPVADESTAVFMEQLYREMVAGQPRDVAMERAKLHLAQRPEYAHPFYWAAFQLHGRGEPLAP